MPAPSQPRAEAQLAMLDWPHRVVARADRQRHLVLFKVVHRVWNACLNPMYRVMLAEVSNQIPRYLVDGPRQPQLDASENNT